MKTSKFRRGSPTTANLMTSQVIRQIIAIIRTTYDDKKFKHCIEVNIFKNLKLEVYTHEVAFCHQYYLLSSSMSFFIDRDLDYADDIQLL